MVWNSVSGAIWYPAQLVDPRKHHNNAMRCVLVGQEGDGKVTVMQLWRGGVRAVHTEKSYIQEGDQSL
jgi:hypothetical protein